MSDPVTNVEIEDVLSSIRKLVAEESRATPPARRREKPGRLVLTPAQRVRDDEGAPTKPAGPVLLTEQVGKTENHDDLPIDTIPGEARLSEFGAVEGAFPDADDVPDARTFRTQRTAPPEQVEDAANESAEEPAAPRSGLSWLVEEEIAAALGLTTYTDTETDEPSEQDAAPAHEDEFSPDAGHATEMSDASLDDRQATPLQIVKEDADTDDDSAADTGAFDTPAQTHAEDNVASTSQEDIPAEKADAVAGPDADLAPEPPRSLEDKVAALGRLVAGNAQEFEEERDGPDADDFTAATGPMTWSDPAPFVEAEEEAPTGSNVLHAENAWPQQKTLDPAQPAAADEPVKDTAPQLPTEAPEETPFEIDEQILRELVGDIVRKELQGALGERITRNVRKLVRREIHRMLISHEFD